MMGKSSMKTDDIPDVINYITQQSIDLADKHGSSMTVGFALGVFSHE
jgi:hypothetical protein